jgi:hypothetical protein
VNEFVGTIDSLDQSLVQGVNQSRVHLILGHFKNKREDRDICDTAEASELSQRVLCVDG